MSNLPKVGDDIYVDTSLYVTHGEDDFIGGLCRIPSIQGKKDENLRIEVEEGKGDFHSWKYSEKSQESLKARFGLNRGDKRPDYRIEFNE